MIFSVFVFPKNNLKLKIMLLFIFPAANGLHGFFSVISQEGNERSS